MKKIAGLTLSALMLTGSLGLASVSANGSTPIGSEQIVVKVTDGTSTFIFDDEMAANVTLANTILKGTTEEVSEGSITNIGGTFTNLKRTIDTVTISFTSDDVEIEDSNLRTFSTEEPLVSVELPDDAMADVSFNISREKALTSKDTPLTITATATIALENVAP